MGGGDWSGARGANIIENERAGQRWVGCVGLVGWV